MKKPKEWLPQYRLNTCTEENCRHYLHSGPCKVKDCECKDGVGRAYKVTKRKKR